MAHSAIGINAVKAAAGLLLGLCLALGASAFLSGCSEGSQPSAAADAAASKESAAVESDDAAKQDAQDSSESQEHSDADSQVDGTPDVIPGATGASEQEAASSVREFLSAFAQKDAAAIKDCLSAVGFDPNDYGITWTCFAQTYYQDLSFSVDRVEEGKNDQGGIGVTFTAQVPVMTKVVELMYQTNKACVKAGADASKRGHANAAWKKAWKKAQVGTNTLSATLYVIKVEDGSWEFQDKTLFAALLMDGYDPRQI